MALAHNGVLYFDELPHYEKGILEAMREPLEDHRILISRVQSKIEYPAKLLFASSMNPCPCGNLLSTTKECRCSDLEVLRYKSRLSDPFLDRIDLFVTMGEPSEHDTKGETSAHMHEQVIKAFVFQKERGQEEFNGKLSESDIEKFCVLSDEATAVLAQGVKRFDLSYRGQNKVIRVARTIADLEQSSLIEKAHIIEALSYRKR